jgi:hypothetical protein
VIDLRPGDGASQELRWRCNRDFVILCLKTQAVKQAWIAIYDESDRSPADLAGVS